MSFIYDNNELLDNLIKSALQHEFKFNKKGQLAADPNINVEFKSYLTLASKLADQLSQKYSPSQESTISTGTNKDAPLGVPELASLGNFLDYVVNNQIMINDQRVAYSGNEKNPDPQHYFPISAQQIKFMMETSQDHNRQQFETEYYVNKDLLQKYIESILQQSSQQDPRAQQLLKVMLGNILQRINQILGTELTTNYQAPKKQDPNNSSNSTTKDLNNEEILQQLSSVLPFNSQYIDFHEISRFIDLYTQLANNSSITQVVNQIHASMDDANQILGAPGLPIQMNNLTLDKFKLLPKQQNQATILANYLYTIISYAGRVYQHFITNYERKMENPAEARAMRQQIAPGGPQPANLAQISKMMQLL